MRDSWLGLCPRQLSRDRNLELIIWLFISIKLRAFYHECLSLIDQNFQLESRPLPTLERGENVIWHNLLSIQNEAISLVAMNSKELRLVQPGKSRHCQTWVEIASLGLKTYSESRIERINCETYKYERKCWKVKSGFVIRAAMWAEKLGYCLECFKILKNALGKPAVAVNTGQISIRVLNKRRKVEYFSLMA